MSPRMKKARLEEWSNAAVSLITAAEACRDAQPHLNGRSRAHLRADMRALALAARKWPMWRRPVQLSHGEVIP